MRRCGAPFQRWRTHLSRVSDGESLLTSRTGGRVRSPGIAKCVAVDAQRVDWRPCSESEAESMIEKLQRRQRQRA